MAWIQARTCRVRAASARRGGAPFSRFYTRRIGVLHEVPARQPVHADRGPRRLRAGAPRERRRRPSLARELGLDPGYLSRHAEEPRAARLPAAPAGAGRRPPGDPLALRAGRGGVRRDQRPLARRDRGPARSACGRRRASGWWRRSRPRPACSATRRSATCPTSCGRISRATSAGWSRGTARSMPRSTASTRRSRRWSPRSARSS